MAVVGGYEYRTAAVEHVVGIHRYAAVFEVVGGVEVELAVAFDAPCFSVVGGGVVAAAEAGVATSLPAGGVFPGYTQGGGVARGAA